MRSGLHNPGTNQKRSTIPPTARTNLNTSCNIAASPFFERFPNQRYYRRPTFMTTLVVGTVFWDGMNGLWKRKWPSDGHSV